MAHIDNILANLVGREHKVAVIEIANEHYQNGFPDPWGISEVAAKAQYISDRTPIPVAMSATSDESDFGITSGQSDYNAADIAMVHFSRDIGTQEGGWLPVRDSWRLGPVGTLPMSSNEPIGAGSSVSTENDPIKLCMAGVFAWTASCVSYVYHSRAGTFGWELCCPPGGQEKFFDASPGSDSYQYMQPLVPKELASWARSDGKDGASPFTNFSGGQANKWWTEVASPNSGVVRNIANVTIGGELGAPQFVERAELKLLPEGAFAPYHAAENLEPAAAKKSVQRDVAAAHRLAAKGIGDAARRLTRAGHDVVGCAALVGPPLPDWTTDEIIAVHVRMHQAEGVLFREVLVTGAKACQLALTTLPEKTALEAAAKALGIPRAQLDAKLAALGKQAGAPWGKDQKEAAAAALVALTR
jgi:hypothetical protein